jgi:hypothetical protein
LKLLLYDKACAALAECKRVDEAKRIHDMAEAMRAYARQAKNRDMEVDAAEIRMRAEIRVGELILVQKALPRAQGGGLNKGTRGAGRPGIGGSKMEPPKTDPTPTLAEVGIDKKLSMRAQRWEAP